MLTSGGPAFTTTHAITLTTDTPAATVGVRALVRGTAGDVPAGAISAIEPAHAAVYFADLGPATITVANAEPTSGGLDVEPDDTYRGRMLGTARTLWTIEAVHQAVLDVDGVIDVLISDPLGGVDVSQSYFDHSTSAPAVRRRAAHRRALPVRRRRGPRVPLAVGDGRPVPASPTGSAPRWTWCAPPGVHPNVIEADHIDVGLRAQLVVQPGYDTDALLARVTQRVAEETAALRLGGDVLFAQVMRALTDEPGVVDVQAMHLRRGPGVFGRFGLGRWATGRPRTRRGWARTSTWAHRAGALPPRLRPQRPAGDAAVIAALLAPPAVHAMRGRFTLPFERGAQARDLDLAPGATPAEAVVVAYDFGEYSAPSTAVTPRRVPAADPDRNRRRHHRHGRRHRPDAGAVHRGRARRRRRGRGQRRRRAARGRQPGGPPDGADRRRHDGR